MNPNPEDISKRWQLDPDRAILNMPIGTIRKGVLHSHGLRKSKEFYLFDFPEWVNVIALTPQEEILLIRQFRYGTKRVELEIPGGMVDPGESPAEAGRRELLEETGFAGDSPLVIGKVCPNPAIQGNYCHTVLVENAVQVTTPRPDDMEEIDWLCVPEQDLDSYVRDGQIEHGLVLNAFSHYSRHKTP